VSRRTVEALWPALHPNHEVDAVLAGGGATPTTNSCAGNRDKAPRRKCSQFLEQLLRSSWSAPAELHARYMNQQCILCGESGRNCQVRLGARSSPGTVGPMPRMQNLVLPIQYAHQAAPSRRALKLLASRAIGCTEASCGHHSAIAHRRRPKSAHASSRALAFRVTTTTSKPTCLLRRLQHTR
jgi:hypothetical protein